MHRHSKRRKWQARAVINAQAMFLGLFEDEWDAAKAFNNAVTAAGKNDRLNSRVLDSTESSDGGANPAQRIPRKRNRRAATSDVGGAEPAGRRARPQTAALAQHHHHSRASSHDPALQTKLSDHNLVDLVGFSRMTNSTLPPPLPIARPIPNVAFMGMETAAFVRNDCGTRTLEMKSEAMAPPVPNFPTNLWSKPKPCTNRSDIANLVS
jgi:hypothetical protein